MNKPITVGFLGMALGLLAPLAQAQFGGEPAKLELIKVRDDIYVISNVAVPGLVTALVTEEGVLLVDDKFEVDHDNILKLLKTVTNQPVKYVINTHYHGDHSGGNAKLQAMKAIVVASDRARAKRCAIRKPRRAP
jgi:glyoxylase-like metal-dependent hydrolase (beta-lactamase superfamily II)